MDIKLAVYNNLSNLGEHFVSSNEKYTSKSIFVYIDDLRSRFSSLPSSDNLVYVSTRSSLDFKLQKGPSCGIAALNMVVNFLSSMEKVSFESMLEEAKKLQITNEGELFFASNLLKLCKLYNLNCKQIDCKDQDSMLNTIAQHLLDKKLILIAYDRDFNNEPCLKKGHKAHWGLLTGLLIQCTDDVLQFSASLVKDDCISILYHQFKPSSSLQHYLLSFANNSTNVYLMHGWSIHTRSMDLYKLVESNWQLREANPALGSHMLIPENGDITNISKCFISIS